MRTPILVLVAAVAAATSLAAGSDSNLPYLKARVKTAVAFKDGTTFLVHEGKVKVGDTGVVVTAPLAAAAFGTVGAVSATPGVRIKMLTASAPPAGEAASLTFTGAVAQRAGRPVLVRRRQESEARRGEFLGLRAPRELAAAVGLPAVTAANEGQEAVLVLRLPGDTLSLVPLSDVADWQFLDGAAVERDPEQTGQQLRIQLEGTKPGQEVTLAYFYLWTGIRWVPSYLAEQQANGRVALTLRGEVTNDLVALEGAELFLAIGVPNFAFLADRSPLAVQQTLVQVGKALARTSPAHAFMNTQVSMTQVTNDLTRDSRVPPEAHEQFAPAPPAALPAIDRADAGNLFLYQVKAVALAKRECALINLAELDLACENLAEWDLTEARIESAGHTVTPQDRAGNPLKQYWLLTAGETPLTTGPVLVMRDGIALAQDLVYYTGRGATGKVSTGTAITVAGQAQYEVLDRQEGRRTVNDHQVIHNGAKIWIEKEIRWIDETRRLTITVTNTGLHRTRSLVRHDFTGTPQANPRVKILQRGGQTETTDAQHRIVWEEVLEPAATKTVTLDYTIRIFTKT